MKAAADVSRILRDPGGIHARSRVASLLYMVSERETGFSAAVIGVVSASLEADRRDSVSISTVSAS